MTAEETAPTEAVPLNSLQALRAWREHKEGVLRAPLSAGTQAAVQRCQAGMMAHAMEQQVQRDAEYLQPLPVAEPLPKRVPQPYTPGLIVTDQVPVPQPPESPMHGFKPMPFSEKALAGVEERAAEEALAQHEAASRADLERWTKGKDLGDEKADEAVENLLDIHDTDPAGETGEIAVLPGLEDEPESE